MSFCKLNGNQPFKTFKNICCSTCNQQFVVKDFTLKGSRCPILLECGHSLCESCLQQNIKALNNFMCGQCGYVSTFNQNEETSECLPLNLYLMGCLFAFQNCKYEKDKRLSNLTNADFSYAMKEQLKKDPNATLCEECNSVAGWFCENCKSNFCDVCWTKVHTSARSLMKHIKILVSNEENKTALKKCPAHETQNLEFYCKGCSLAVCPHCIILHHQGEGHCPITLKDKNLEVLAEVKVAAEEAEMISKRMKQTLEKIKLTLFTVVPDNKPYSDLETEIMKNFGRLHGILQLEEEYLIKKLRKSANERENCLKNLSVRLESHMENISSLLREYEILSRKPQTGDLTDVYRKLLEVKNLPCYLILQKGVKEDAKLTFDDNLIHLFPTYCTLNLPSNDIFELKSGEDLPEDYTVEPIHSSFLDFDQRAPVTDLNDSEIESVSNCSSKLSKSDLDTKTPKPIKRSNLFMERKIYSVRITYIRNPGEFYVALSSQRANHRSIDKRASQFASSSSAVPETVCKGEIYLVKYKGDGKWYRARVIEVSPHKNEREDCIEVYYLDYGNTENVPLARLRPIPEELLEEVPIAIKCKLFDCFPKKGEWCLESTKVMETMLENSTATMFVMKVHPDCLEVDLSKISPKSQIGSEITSIRDALVFLEFTNLVGGRRKPRQLNPLRYLNQCLPQMGEIYEVIVTHVNSPSDFYVQKKKLDAPLAYSLSVDMKNFYTSNLHKGVIYNPNVGMPCAAVFSEDQKWYRAKIIDIPGKKMITVLFIDYGNKETVPWSSIRKLKENFAKQSPLALNCSLAEIQPNDSTRWNVEAAEYMKKSLCLKQCRIKVQGKTKSKQKLKVFLYKKTEKKEICVNALLVKMGHAFRNSSLGTEDFTKEKVLNEMTPALVHENTKTEDDESDENRKFSYDNEIKKSNFIKRKKNKLSAQKLRELHASEKLNEAESTSTTEEDNISVQSDTTPSDDIFKPKVEVLSAESPSSVYVTFPALQDVLPLLQSKLDEFYENSTFSESDIWDVDCKCVVYSSTKNGWYRATILKILPDDKVKVFLRDIAYETTEKMSSLRVLDPSFAKFVTCAVKCHLSDIRPVGEKWPSISCEFLSNELENYKSIYMTKKGEIEKKSLPVELSVRKIVSGSALEPMVKKWVTLNRLLVDQGLAIPTKSYPEDNDLKVIGKDCVTSECEKEVLKSSDAFIPSLSSRWLPPLKLKRTQFVGMPTYVDYNACIYMYDVEEDEEMLKSIRESLAKEYENSKPTPDDHFWSPEQLCIVKYHADNFWYRGVVLQTNENLTYEVLFVDYGNVETCQASEMRKRIKMEDIPVLAHKFQLHGIVPISEDGKWPLPSIEFLHSSIVDKLCEVNVIKKSLDPEEFSSILLKLIDKDVDVGSFLIDKGLAQSHLSWYDISEMEKMEDEDVSDDISEGETPLELLDLKNNKEENIDINTDYPSLEISEDCKSFYILITTADINQNKFCGNIVDHQSLPIELQQVLSNFEKLQEDLTDQCPDQPILEKFREGQPCCYLSPEIGKWCRAEIEVFKENDKSIFVVAVDYGHREYLKKNLLRECKNEWLNLPKVVVKFRLAGIDKCTDIPNSAYITALTKCLKSCLFFAEVVNRQEEFLEVKLYNEKNGSLAYQEMIDDALMQITE